MGEPTPWRRVAALVSLSMCALPVFAQVARSGGANAALVQQMQQALADNASLQAQVNSLKQRLDASTQALAAAQKQLKSSKAAASASSAQLSSVRAAGENTSKELALAKSQMRELVAHYRDTIATLRKSEADNGKMRRTLSGRQASLTRCTEDNRKLYRVTTEVLDRYQHQGLFQYLARSEPFTRLERTRIENFADEYGQQARELKAPSPGSPAKPGPRRGGAVDGSSP
ncbi:MAG: hypothetical protein KGL34_10780 [Gammaproteobacteria bacterium]|nr:hypothetical protein [Gammaproteobacteria bacterium]